MNNYRTDTITLLKLALTALENLDDVQCEKLLKEEAFLKYVENDTESSQTKKKKKKSKKRKTTTKEKTEMINKASLPKEISIKEKANKIALDLRLINSRSTAYSLLNKKNVNKELLFQVAKKLNIDICKNDTKAKLVARIVESTV